AKETQAEADRLAKQRIYTLYVNRSREYEDQIAKCRLVAPHDGMVIYYQSKQSKSGSGSQLSIIAQGEPVFEGQKVMTSPSLTRAQLDDDSVPYAAMAPRSPRRSGDRPSSRRTIRADRLQRFTASRLGRHSGPQSTAGQSIPLGGGASHVPRARSETHLRRSA